MDIEADDLTEKQVEDISLRIKNKLNGKMGYQSKKSRSNLLKALISLSEKSLIDGYISLSAETAPGGELTTLVQHASGGLDWD